MYSRLAQGQAGVYTVAAQFLLRGINPCFPAVDCGRITKVNVETGFSKTLLEHENRWDLLLAAEQLLSEGEANLEVSAIAEEV